VYVRRDVLAEPTADIDDRHGAVVVEISDHGGGDVPLLPAGKFSEAILAYVEEGVVLAYGEWRDRRGAIVGCIRRCVKLSDEGDTS
jgi:hypothetical protein